MRRTKLLLAGLAAAAALFSGCGKAGSGNAERPLVIYTSLESEQVNAYIGAFRKAHPEVRFNLVRDSTGIVTAKLLAEAANPQADVIWGVQCTSLLELESRGLFEPYAPAGVDKIRPEFKSPLPVPSWVGIHYVDTVIAVNPREAGRLNLPPVNSFDDLLRPEFKERVVAGNPGSSGIALMFVSGMLQSRGEQPGWNFLARLNENVKLYAHSGSKPAKMVAMGEFPVGITSGYAAMQQQKKGAPIRLVFPAEGVPFDCEANALVRKPAIHPHAKLFLDWAISDEAMKVYKTMNPLVTRTGDSGVYPDGSTPKLLPHDLARTVRDRAAVIKQWNDRFAGKSPR